jgi:hypothetical protein
LEPSIQPIFLILGKVKAGNLHFCRHSFLG